MSSILALAAAILFGAGDFLGGLASRRARLLMVLLVSQGVGLAGLVPVALLVGGSPRLADMAIGAAAGLAGGAGLVMLYAGLAGAAMSLVAPVTGVVAAVIPAAAGLALGDRPGIVRLAGMACALVAVAMLSGGSAEPGRRLRGRSLVLACGAGIGFGAFYIVLSMSSSAAGLWPLVAARSASTTAFLMAVAATGVPRRLDAPGLRLIVPAGGFDVAANALYLVAVHRGLLSVVAVLVSLYPGSTIVCALIFLGERLRPIQIAGVLAALVAVTLITAG